MKVRYDDNRLDSTENAFFNRELEHVRENVHKEEFPELKARGFVYFDSSAPDWCETITTRSSTDYGQARSGGGGYETEAPMVDFLTKEGSVLVRPVTVAYGWSVNEIRASNAMNRNLDGERARIAMEVVERKFDEIALVGGTLGGQTYTGLFNTAGTTTYTVPTLPSGKTFEDKSPDEVLEDMFAMENTAYSATNEIERPNTLVLPTTSLNLISKRRLGDGSDQTILKYFLANSKFIKRVESHYRLETLGAGSTKRMCSYVNDPTRLEMHVPLPFEQHAPQSRGFRVIIPCEGRTAGLEIHRPKSVTYADGI